MGLLREQAHALRESVAAAARSNRAASAFAAAQLGERLLDQARALADARPPGAAHAGRRRGGRRERDPLLRVAVFAADGSREDLAAAPAPDGEHGGRGPRAGWARRSRRRPGGGPGRAGAGAAAVARAAAAPSSGRSSRRARTRW